MAEWQEEAVVSRSLLGKDRFSGIFRIWGEKEKASLVCIETFNEFLQQHFEHYFTTK